MRFLIFFGLLLILVCWVIAAAAAVLYTIRAVNIARRKLRKMEV